MPLFVDAGLNAGFGCLPGNAPRHGGRAFWFVRVHCCVCTLPYPHGLLPSPPPTPPWLDDTPGQQTFGRVPVCLLGPLPAPVPGFILCPFTIPWHLRLVGWTPTVTPTPPHPTPPLRCVRFWVAFGHRHCCAVAERFVTGCYFAAMPRHAPAPPTRKHATRSTGYRTPCVVPDVVAFLLLVVPRVARCIRKTGADVTSYRV